MTNALAALAAAHAVRIGRPLPREPGARVIRRYGAAGTIELPDGTLAVTPDVEPWLARCGDDPATAGGRFEQETGDA